MAPWDRQPNEPSAWFERFERFRLLGANRTIEAVFQQEQGDAKGSKGKRPTRHWYEAADTYQWRWRSEAWDDAERQKERDRYEQERQKEREARLALLRAGRSRLAQALTALDATKLKPAEVFSALRIILQESRAEYDDEPTQRIREEPIPPVDWELVPDEMQVAFLERQLTLAQILAYVAQHKPSGS